MGNKKISFFHVLNDFSGSPYMLSLVIRGLVEKGYKIDLYTSSSIRGFLSGIAGVEYHEVPYRISKNKLYTLFLLILSQLRYFLVAARLAYKNDSIIYINTIMPFGAALGAKLFGKNVIYHVHENLIRSNPINKIAKSVFLGCAGKAIFVSEYLFNIYKLDEKRKHLIYNALAPQFVEIAQKHKLKYEKPENILLICSLRIYKGVNVFIDLAGRLPQYKFTMVLNASENEALSYFKNIVLPSNIEYFTAQTDLHRFYSRAQLVVNLSLPDQWIETFGLTILEAMCYGIPVIIPPVGGITELVKDGASGFLIDARDIEKLVAEIPLIFTDQDKYYKMSENIRNRSMKYSYSGMIESIDRILDQRQQF